MANKVTLTANQKKALAALLAHKSVRAAAGACGLAERTLWRYLSEDAFLQALQDAQSAIYTAATTRLTNGLQVALDELERLMISAESEAVRRQAVSEWLTHALRLRELIDLEARLAALESRTL